VPEPVTADCGWSSFTTARDPRRDVGAMLAALPPDAFPRIVATAAAMGAYGSDEHYEYVLDQLIAGLRR
jgi:hypothetical protein